jgi:4-alpha-glucanotransferase
MKYDPAKQGRSSGIVVSIQALRSERSQAAGEFPDLPLLGKLASSWGFDLIQLLPVNDSGFQSSPYSALSAFALHPLFISIADLPELAAAADAKPLGKARNAGKNGCGAESAAFLAEAEALAVSHAKDARFAYGPYLEAKLDLLERIWKSLAAPVLFDGKAGTDSQVAEFEAFIAANAWVKDYAVFTELKRKNGGLPWWQWASMRDPTPESIAAAWDSGDLASGCRFRAWLQWRAEGQFRAAKAALDSSGIALMGDIPILINEDSAEVWARRSVFKLGLAAGAPPDMYAELGQNWGFPIYDWEAAKADDYSFWKARLASAEKFYAAYRIDHVLGFFRIWALSGMDSTGYLGRFVPDAYITTDELAAAGFGPERLRWLSRPHVPTSRLLDAVQDDATAAMEAEELILDRIGNEELFLFKPTVRGEKDIEAMSAKGYPGYGGPGLATGLKDCLLASWRDRVLYEFEPGRFVPTWRYYGATAWPSLSDDERRRLEGLFAAKRAEGDREWEATGRRLLGALVSSSSMLPCAEDLGSVPACVPAVLGELGIFGLRVLRWARNWDAPGQPFVQLSRYPRLTVACPSVHDSSSLREWYETEADRGQAWAFAAQSLGRDLGPAPDTLSPGAVAIVLEAMAGSASAIAVYPMQDLLALGSAFRPEDPSEERVNKPGTTNEWNWGWRLPGTLESILADAGLAKAARGLAAARKPRS